jgi:hypothetical protein
MTIEDICQRLRQERDNPSIQALEFILEDTDKEVVKLFAGMTANDVYAHRDARKLVQQRLNRLRGARDRE